MRVKFGTQERTLAEIWDDFRVRPFTRASKVGGVVRHGTARDQTNFHTHTKNKNKKMTHPARDRQKKKTIGLIFVFHEICEGNLRVKFGPQERTLAEFLG